MNKCEAQHENRQRLMAHRNITTNIPPRPMKMPSEAAGQWGEILKIVAAFVEEEMRIYEFGDGIAYGEVLDVAFHDREAENAELRRILLQEQ